MENSNFVMEIKKARDRLFEADRYLDCPSDCSKCNKYELCQEFMKVELSLKELVRLASLD